MENHAVIRTNLAKESTNVTGAKMIAARFGHEVIARPSFNAVVRVAYHHGYLHLFRQHGQRAAALKWLKGIAGRKMVEGDNGGNRMIYLPSIGVSVWDRSNSDALRTITILASLTGSDFELRVRFAHDSSKYSGKEAVLWWSPEASRDELDQLIG